MKYWVERWSELRMKEMIHYPEVFVIHNDYLKTLPEEDIRNGFGELFDVLSTTWCYCTLGDYEDEYLRKTGQITEDIVRKGNILIENIKM